MWAETHHDFVSWNTKNEFIVVAASTFQWFYCCLDNSFIIYVDMHTHACAFTCTNMPFYQWWPLKRRISYNWQRACYCIMLGHLTSISFWNRTSGKNNYIVSIYAFNSWRHKMSFLCLQEPVKVARVRWWSRWRSSTMRASRVKSSSVSRCVTAATIAMRASRAAVGRGWRIREGGVSTLICRCERLHQLLNMF